MQYEYLIVFTYARNSQMRCGDVEITRDSKLTLSDLADIRQELAKQVHADRDIAIINVISFDT